MQPRRSVRWSLWWAATGGLAAVGFVGGAVVLGPGALLFGLLLANIVAVAGFVDESATALRHRTRRALRWACSGLLAWTALLGGGLLFGGWTLLLVPALGCLGLLMRRDDRKLGVESVGRRPRQPVAVPAAQLPGWLAAAAPEDLCHLLATTAETVRSCDDPAAVAELAAARAAILDELESRDAEGFTRWLNASPGADPLTYLGKRSA